MTSMMITSIGVTKVCMVTGAVIKVRKMTDGYECWRCEKWQCDRGMLLRVVGRMVDVCREMSRQWMIRWCYVKVGLGVGKGMCGQESEEGRTYPQQLHC